MPRDRLGPARRVAAVLAVAMGVTLGSIGGSSGALAAPTAMSSAGSLVPTAVPSVPVSVQKYYLSSGFGTSFSGEVVSPTGARLWSANATTTRLPASTMKLVTAYVALTSLGPTRRMRTDVLQSVADPSVVYLRGLGDPTLTVTAVRNLAATAAAALKAQHRTRVSVGADAWLYPAPTNAIGWLASYVPSEATPVRSLSIAGRPAQEGDLDAALVFAGALGQNGIGVSGVTRRKTPSSNRLLASSSGYTIDRIVRDMLRDSNNNYAERLLRDAAWVRGRPTSWAGATANATAVLTAAGLPRTGMAMYDGSGLSRSDRLAAPSLNVLVRYLWTSPAPHATIFAADGTPVAGRTGTLVNRFTSGASACARGSIQAKTGTLSDVVALSGVAHGVDGVDRYFSFFLYGRGATTTTLASLDAMAAAVTGCLT